MKQESIVAGGGILYRKSNDKNKNSGKSTEIALIKRRGVWDLPKGKQDPGESIIDCARREVAEELGIEWPTVHQHIGQTRHTYVESGVEILKTTYWYAMIPHDNNPAFTPEVEEQIEQVTWVPIDSSFKIVAYDNLLPILHAFDRIDLPG